MDRRPAPSVVTAGVVALVGRVLFLGQRGSAGIWLDQPIGRIEPFLADLDVDHLCLLHYWLWRGGEYRWHATPQVFDILGAN